MIDARSRTNLSVDVTDPARFIAAIRHALVTELIKLLVQGTRLLVLTAPAGAGKTTLANFLRQELLDRSVRILWIDCRSTGSIDLRTLTSQLLDKDMAEFSAVDIEARSTRSQPIAGEKRVLIIDDAERLTGDALVYLRLQSSIAAAEIPQIVLFAHPSLFNAAELRNRTDLRDLITDSRELRLLDDNEAKAFATLSVPETEFGEGTLDALVRHGGGLIGRIASLLPIAATIRDERGLSQLTVAEIDAAADRLDGDEVATQDEPAAQIASGSRRHAVLVSVLVCLPIALAAVTAGFWLSASQPHLLPRAESSAKADALTSTTAGAVEPLSEPTAKGGDLALTPAGQQVQFSAERPPPVLIQPNPWFRDTRATRARTSTGSRSLASREPEQRASSDQIWALAADLLDNGAGTASAEANDASIAPRGTGSETADEPAEAAAQSATLEPFDHPRTPPAETTATAAETASGVQHIGDAREPMIATAETAAPHRSARAADHPTASPAATAATAQKTASDIQHIGDARESVIATAEITAPDRSARAADHPMASPAETTAQETASDVPHIGDARESMIATAETAAPDRSARAADHPTASPAETAATAQETASDIEHIGDARESVTATAETAAPDRSARAADQPEPPEPVTAQAASSESPVPEHVGDVREAPSVRASPVADVRLLLERGGAMLALGDIVAARLFYERAAALGSAEAATSIGKTYDPAFLVSIAATGTEANPRLAAFWYREAAKLSDPNATGRLATTPRR